MPADALAALRAYHGGAGRGDAGVAGAEDARGEDAEEIRMMNERDYILVSNKTLLASIQIMAGTLMEGYGVTKAQKRAILKATSAALERTFKQINDRRKDGANTPPRKPRTR